MRKLACGRVDHAIVGRVTLTQRHAAIAATGDGSLTHIVDSYR